MEVLGQWLHATGSRWGRFELLFTMLAKVKWKSRIFRRLDGIELLLRTQLSQLKRRMKNRRLIAGPGSKSQFV